MPFKDPNMIQFTLIDSEIIIKIDKHKCYAIATVKISEKIHLHSYEYDGAMLEC